MYFSPALILDGGVIQSVNSVVHVEPFTSKRAMEFAHLQHFKRVCALVEQYEKYRWRLVGDGADPPDFVISRRGRVLGLELTAFASDERRKQTRFFGDIQTQFVEEYRKGRLRNLAGIRIEISFSKLGGVPSKISHEVLLELIDGFEALRRLPWEKTSSDVKETVPFPLSESGTADSGRVTWYVSFLADGPLIGHGFSDETGFDVCHSYRGEMAVSEVLWLLEDCIRKKDRAGNDELLISVSAPALDGRAYVDEGTTLRYALKTEWKGLSFVPIHLQRIFIDIWGIGMFVAHDTVESVEPLSDSSSLPSSHHLLFSGQA